MVAPAFVPVSLSPREQLRTGRLPRRLAQLVFGLVLYGWSIALMFEAGLGLDPWDVFHQGLTHYLPLTLGQVVIGVGALVLLLWVPLRQWPGIGTVLNVVLIGLAVDLGVWMLHQPDSWVLRALMLVAGIVLNGLACALYIGAHLGTGPRDGLFIGLSRRTGLSIRLMRTSVEVTVLALGWLLGGTVGVGTVAYALAIGPLVQAFMPWAQVRLPAQTRVARMTEASSETITSTATNRSSVSHCSRTTSTRPS